MYNQWRITHGRKEVLASAIGYTLYAICSYVSSYLYSSMTVFASSFSHICFTCASALA